MSFTLSTGREVYANCNLVSIPIDGSGDLYEFYEGYDGGFSIRQPWMKGEDDYAHYLTKSEALEICDAMLKAWKIRRKAIARLDDATHS